MARAEKGRQPFDKYEPNHKLILGKDTKHFFMISHGNLNFWTEIRGTEIPPNTKPVPFPDLPEELRKNIEELKMRYMGG